MQIIIQILSALCASFGFALIFRLQGKSVLFASLGGALTWGVFLLCRLELSNLFLLNLIAAAFAAFYSEAMARVQNAVHLLSRSEHYSARAGQFALLYASLFDR